MTQAEYCAGVTTTNRKRILPCCTPQNSEHSPRYVPVVSGMKGMWFTWPGIMSTLPPICGTQNEWITSADSRSMRRRAVDGHVDLVGRLEAQRLEVELPPPLVADGGELRARVGQRERSVVLTVRTKRTATMTAGISRPDDLDAQVAGGLEASSSGRLRPRDDHEDEQDPDGDEHDGEDGRRSR